jgi:hypothetical protein
LREKILSEIRRLTAQNGGSPPGQSKFANETGIARSAWRGVFWARWSDALREAGFSPNAVPQRKDPAFILQKLAEACRHYRRVPSHPELRMYKQVDPAFPAAMTVRERFRSKDAWLRALNDWVSQNDEYKDVRELLSIDNAPPAKSTNSREGWVYLIKWGAHHKIGRSDDLERRVKQVQTGLPEAGELVHAIKTDDPVGIEAYWHERFADRRAPNGEWFKLSASDVAAFKKRKFQ